MFQVHKEMVVQELPIPEVVVVEEEEMFLNQVQEQVVQVVVELY